MWIKALRRKCYAMSAQCLHHLPVHVRSFFHSGKFRPRYTTVAFFRTIPSLSIGSQLEGRCFMSGFSKSWRRNWPPLMRRSSIISTGLQTMCLGLLSRGRNMNLGLSVPIHERISKISWSVKRANWRHGSDSTCPISGSCASSAAKKLKTMDDEEEEYELSSAISSHGRKVYTDYSIIGILGDGRCLFRSVVHGACLLSGNPPPNESLQKELADELRSRIADEFVKKREETEWFVEGDFDTYVSRIRQPHVWGGEPELFMASQVLQMPITVYMHDCNSGGLITIAEYGQEYGKAKPIRVLYHGYGHYDVLQIPGKNSSKSRL